MQMKNGRNGVKPCLDQTGQTLVWQTPTEMHVKAWLNWKPRRDDTPGTAADLDSPGNQPEPIQARLSEYTPVLSDVAAVSYWKTWQEASRMHLENCQWVDQEDIRQDVVFSAWQYGVRQLENQGNPMRGISWIPKRIGKAVERLTKEQTQTVAYADHDSAKEAAETRYAERQDQLHKDYLRQITEDLLKNNPKPVKTECLMKW